MLPAVDIAEDKHLDRGRLNALTFEHALRVPEQTHPGQKPKSGYFIKHIRKLICALAFEVPQKPLTGPLVFLARDNLAVYYGLAV
jgi:hypothetical protein